MSGNTWGENQFKICHKISIENVIDWTRHIVINFENRLNQSHDKSNRCFSGKCSMVCMYVWWARIEFWLCSTWLRIKSNEKETNTSMTSISINKCCAHRLKANSNSDHNRKFKWQLIGKFNIRRVVERTTGNGTK